MRIWALSDLHLSLSGAKPMDQFGDHWVRHEQRMAEAWDDVVAADDIVLSPGDFCWALKPQQAEPDLAWLAERPGRKVLIKGNHDYWWPKSQTKLEQLMPPNTWALKKRAAIIDGVALFGCRGGDFAPLTRYGDTRTQQQIDEQLDKEARELQQSIEHLHELSRQGSQPERLRVCLFHYPPIPPGRRESRFTTTIQQARASVCVYGHLHGSELGSVKVEGTIDGVRYVCASCDQIAFAPLLISEC